MLVYRVETEDTRVGPYMAGDHAFGWSDGLGDPYVWAETERARAEYADHLAYSHNGSNGHPGPFKDFDSEGQIALNTWHRFGFANQDQVLAWFTDEWDDLARLGYVVRVFEVDPADVITGDLQVAFVYAEAREVETIPMKEDA